MNDVIGVILAAGKSTRMNLEGKNKTSLELNGKSLVQYGVDLLSETCDNICIVVGAYSDSVKQAIQDSSKIFFALQKEQLGTGHAVLEAINEIEKRRLVTKHIVIGYGDHMYKYDSATIKEFVQYHRDNQNYITLISTIHDNPDFLGWGRVVRDSSGNVKEIIEQKNATDDQRKITEVNAGFYIVDYGVIKDLLSRIKPNSISKEIYLTDIVDIAHKKNLKVGAFKVDFEKVGYGINTQEHLDIAKNS